MASLQWIADWLRDNIPLVGGALAWLVEQIEQTWDTLINTAYDLANNAWDWIQNTGATIEDWVDNTGSWLVDTANKIGQIAWQYIKPIVQPVIDTAENIVDIIWQTIQPTIDSIWNGLNNIGQTAWQYIKPYVDPILNGWDWVTQQASKVPDILQSLTNMSQDFTTRLENLASQIPDWLKSAGKSADGFLDWVASGIKQRIRDFVVWLAIEVVKTLIQDFLDIKVDTATGRMEGQPQSPITSLLTMETEA